MAILLGDVVKDSISGYEGVVIGVTEWLHGCRRMIIQPQELNKDGKPVESVSFDEPQLILLKSKVHSGSRETGGPRPEPDRGR